MAKRKKRREKEPVATVDYADSDGNVLALRSSLSPASVSKIRSEHGKAAASAEDAYARREELLFERLVVSWTIAGLPLEDQKMLLGRYRMADSDERDWVRSTLAAHVERYIPDLAT